MSLLGRIMTLFPALVVLLAAWSGLWFLSSFSAWALLCLVGALYALPLLAFRVHQRLFPVAEGPSLLVGPSYSPWYGAHQLQLIYLAFPGLERALRLVPGLYSTWLRLWGSRVGKRVYWTPVFDVADRSLLEIGDDVVFGYRVTIFGHVIKPTRKNMLLYVRRVRVESRAFIGAGAVLAPGTVIREGAFVPAGSHLYPNTESQE